MSAGRFLGIVVNPLYVQNEGLQQVFDNLQSVRAGAICISPYVAYPSEKGARFPPLHVDGHARLVARPAWGQHEISLESIRGYAPDLGLYAGTIYKPVVGPAPPGVDTTIPAKMIAEAHKRGMQAHMLMHPFLPPGLRLNDQPMHIDGTRPQPPQVAASACLNAPNAATFGLALIEDSVRHYPSLTGIIPDWVEYGAYALQDHFTCFCPHCQGKAEALGFDWELIRRDVTALWNWLHALTPEDLERSRRVAANPGQLAELLIRYRGWTQFLAFKAASVVGFYHKARQLLDDLGFSSMTISARGWPPPWNRSSGMDYRELAGICTAVTPKLFTFDYSALPRWYGQTLAGWNPALVESDLLDSLVAWMNLPDGLEPRLFAKYRIPAPEEPHPAKIEAYQSRLDEVVDQAGGRALCYPIAHAYLPEAQWQQMVRLVRDSRVDGMWVQMYGYLSDRKLAILREAWR
jgi:hypothetical protein